MSPNSVNRERSLLVVRQIVLSYSALLALTAGFVNAVAILIFALPVGNLTGVTTQLGMKAGNPLLYEGHVLAAVMIGFFLGAVLAGSVLPVKHSHVSSRSALVLCIEAVLLLVAAAGVEETYIREAITASGVELPAVQALLAAAALGLQNGLTSSFRDMAVRTTHFTGTITDLGLIVGRSRRHGVDRWKALTLGLTLVLFLVGGAAGIVAGSRYGGYALAAPAAACIAMAGAAMLRHRMSLSRLRREAARV
ncbi:YoaK family protein [Candidatus Mycobacterium wuenschmannii]|uniref:YoaK family protein n=1 Tax=Candidatus Mycobacterium wuenschmannii TaxID=3027808 RepID=A0ABY8VSY0_9MYCO|nr:YoaK family protein [Candidatus Mycobacterium wuenschmannii]WIM86728.1 YoaK family protein [Candidatus Mycobacterium wuenschmannii]